MSRHDTLFALRYAVRVLERHARMWRRIDGLIRFSALLAGSSAFAGLMAANSTTALVAGIVFAVLQSVEFAIRPAEIAARSMTAKKPYGDILARQAELDDAQLESAYQRCVAEDDVIVPENLRYLAYNDVVQERGGDPASLYAITRWQRLGVLFA